MHSDSYAAFLKLVRELNVARSIDALLDWDQETVMPRRGAGDRANQAAFIAGIAHQRLTSDELGKALEKLEAAGDLGDPAAAANVREVRREYTRAVKLPTALVQDIARAVALGKEAWASARRESAFGKFAPHLEKLLDLKRDVADRVGWTSEPYDALMDEFEPGAKAADVQTVFDKLKSELVPLVQAIAGAARQPDLSVLQRQCPKEAQAAFNASVAQAMGFDYDAGRIDVSTHPFCTSLSPLDVRMTTRYDEKYMPMSLFGIMHETGHGLYEQGFDPANTGTPMAQAVSLGIHESQSRMWENQIGRSRPFWNHFYPQLQAAFPSMKDVSLDAWVFGVNNVRPSLIRVEADEVTYGLHIMLRFDLERRMIRRELAVKDIPAAWNDGMKSLLGITPPNDAQGCLQDIHWSLATFGYFPTYALGNLYAAQFYDKARQEIGDLDGKVGRGELLPLREWLREKIHRHGKRYRASELVKVVTGRELSHQPFVDYLKSKFRPLYGLA